MPTRGRLKRVSGCRTPPPGLCGASRPAGRPPSLPPGPASASSPCRPPGGAAGAPARKRPSRAESRAEPCRAAAGHELRLPRRPQRCQWRRRRAAEAEGEAEEEAEEKERGPGSGRLGGGLRRLAGDALRARGAPSSMFPAADSASGTAGQPEAPGVAAAAPPPCSHSSRSGEEEEEAAEDEEDGDPGASRFVLAAGLALLAVSVAYLGRQEAGGCGPLCLALPLLRLALYAGCAAAAAALGALLGLLCRRRRRLPPPGFPAAPRPRLPAVSGAPGPPRASGRSWARSRGGTRPRGGSAPRGLRSSRLLLAECRQRGCARGDPEAWWRWAAPRECPWGSARALSERLGPLCKDKPVFRTSRRYRFVLTTSS